MKVTPGSTDVTTYFSLVLLDGTDATALTITDLDLQYVRSGAAPSTKVDATALATTSTAHADNQAIEVDATDQPGLYRVDWPDAAFAAAVREVILTVKHTLCKTAHLRVELETVQTALAPTVAQFWAGAASNSPAFRDVSAVTAPTYEDCLGAAFVLAASNEAITSGTTYTRKQPDDSSTFVVFTTNSATEPTSRTR